MKLRWPWAPAREATTHVERKAAGGLLSLHLQGDALWTRRDYGALAREGYMRNPVVHRCVRMIAEAAATAP